MTKLPPPPRRLLAILEIASQMIEFTAKDVAHIPNSKEQLPQIAKRGYISIVKRGRVGRGHLTVYSI